MVRPAEVCAALLAALEAAEGRRRSRKRDQTPDAIGLAIKRICSSAWSKRIHILKHSKSGCSAVPKGAVRRNRLALCPPWREPFLKNGVLPIPCTNSKVG